MLTGHAFTERLGDFRHDYQSAARDPLRRQRRGLGGGADAHLRSWAAFNEMRETARDMDRNDAVIGSLLDRATNNIVGEPPVPEFDTGDPGLNQELWERYANWSGNPRLCSLTGDMTFAEMVWLAVRQGMFLDGDVLINPISDGTLQAIEAEHLDTPPNLARSETCVFGVETRNGRNYRYWVREEGRPLDRTPGSGFRALSAFDDEGYAATFHLLSRRRFSAKRGVTALWPICGIATMFEDLNYAELVRAQVLACISLFIEAPATGLGALTEETDAGGNTRTLTDLYPGLVHYLRTGEKPHMFSPNVPGGNYFEHVRLLLQLVSVALGLPLVVALMDASETNFSGWRGAVNEAKRGWRRAQWSLKARLLTPNLQLQIRRWMQAPAARGGLGAAARDNPNVLRHDWRFGKWSSVNPNDDADAEKTRLQTGQASPRGLAAERGEDFETITQETVEDNTDRIRRAMDAAAKLGNGVTWRDLLDPAGLNKAGGAKPEAGPAPKAA